MSGPTGTVCPECGRPVPPGGAKLCPSCGYPLLFDRPPPVADDRHKVARKPPSSSETIGFPYPLPTPPPAPPGPPRFAPPPQPVQRYAPEPVRVLGPHCPACGRVNPPHRKRCEVCGCELWPGAAQPPRVMPPQPVVAAAPPRRRSWLPVVLVLGIALIGVATVWLLAYLL